MFRKHFHEHSYKCSSIIMRNSSFVHWFKCFQINLNWSFSTTEIVFFFVNIFTYCFHFFRFVRKKLTVNRSSLTVSFITFVLSLNYNLALHRFSLCTYNIVLRILLVCQVNKLLKFRFTNLKNHFSCVIILFNFFFHFAQVLITF